MLGRMRWKIPVVVVAVVAVLLVIVYAGRTPDPEAGPERAETAQDAKPPTSGRPSLPVTDVAIDDLSRRLPSPGRTPPDPIPPVAAAPWVDEDGEPTQAFVSALIREGIEEHLPSYKLSSDEVERLAEATTSMRRAQQELRSLPYEPEYAERRRALLETVEDATATFDDILDMSPGDFTQALEPEVGIDDAWEDDGEVPEPEFLEPRVPEPQ